MVEHKVLDHRIAKIIRGRVGIVSTAVIRLATPADLEAASIYGAEIVRFHHQTNPQRFFLPEDVESGYRFWIGKELNRKGAVVLVAELDGAIVGYAYGTIEDRDWSVLIDRHGVIQDVCVAQAARGRGIGRQLVEDLIKRLEALGAPRVLLYAMVQNENARRLFSSLGFEATMVEMTREARRD